MVDFPLKGLDLTNYLPALLPPNIAKVEGYGQEEVNPTTDPRAQVPPYKYDLYGVTNHFGNLSSGHCEFHEEARLYACLTDVQPRYVLHCFQRRMGVLR